MKKVLEAACFAAHKHTHHRRKNIEDIPYINHPLEVAHLLSSTEGIADEDILCAGLLHDTVEDTGTRAKEITSLFGEAVTAYVLEVSDNKNLPKAERKKLQVLHAGSLSEGATLIKLADRISNLRSIAAEPPKGWTVQRQIDYFTWSMDVFNALRKTGRPLENLFLKEYREGLDKVLLRKEDEHTFHSWWSLVRKKFRARLLRLARFGPP